MGNEISASPRVGSTDTDPAAAGASIRIATCQFAVGPDPAENSAVMRRQLAQAAAQGADIAHFPEGALSGYPKADYYGDSGPDWSLIDLEIEALHRAAAENNIGIVFGTVIRNDAGLPSNCVMVVSGSGEQVARYDKRFITSGEVGVYAPGDHPTVFNIGGVRCGIIICYEKWFPELFRDYARRGVHLIFDSIHSPERDLSSAVGKSLIGDADRALWIAYARINHTWISVSNHCRPEQDNTSFLVDPDGRLSMLPFKEQSVRTFTIDLSTEYWDPSGPFRDLALAGEMRVRDASEVRS